MSTANKTDEKTNNAQTQNHPTLMLIRGLPGSGKSYLATALQERLGKDNVLILDPDKIDLTSQEYLDFSKSMAKDGIEEKFHPYRWSRAQAYDAIMANKVIIWNQGFTNLDGFNKTVVNLQTYATDHGTHLPLLLVEVEINHDVAKQRVSDRAAQGGHNVNDENFARFINDYATFADQGYDPVVLNGENDIAASVSTVMQALQELWEKEQ